MSVFKVRGVLGQDFLQQFDVLIDYRHLIIQLAPASGALAQILTGEHLALHIDQANPGRSAPNRLIISGYVPELGAEEMSLLLDSGANCFTLFHDNLGPLANRIQQVNTGNFGSWTKSEMATRTIRVLRLGTKSVPDLTVVTISHPMNTDYGWSRPNIALQFRLHQQPRRVRHPESHVSQDKPLNSPGWK